MNAVAERLRAFSAGARAQATTRFEGLAPRERLLLAAAAAVAGLLIVWLGLWEPLAARQTRVVADVERARRDAAEIGDLVRRHDVLRREVEALEGRAARSETSLFARLEDVAVPIVGRERVTAMNPAHRKVDDRFEEETVDLRLEGISMDRVVRLLHALELGEEPVHVARLTLKRQYKDPGVLDVTLVVSRLAPASN